MQTQEQCKSAAIETVQLQMLRGLPLLNYQEKQRTITREPRTIQFSVQQNDPVDRQFFAAR